MPKTEAATKARWNFDNSYARLPDNFYSRIHPVPVRSPELVILNDSLAESLGLDVAMLKSSDGVAMLAGNRIPEGASPIAQAYAGHQFGHFTILGDGRAILLGEQITPKGERYDIQLKGSGITPYSRGGDGRAALGPMLREFIISEAMHGLGIPTTRSLAVVATGEPVYRETALPGAVLTRVAASHIRVGTFQYAANWGTVEDVRILADYTIGRHYPEVIGETAEVKYLSFLQAVIERQAVLIAKWQLVGFIHGVMNTDNMAVSGETIDYGPCAFMDNYDPATVFSSIDVRGRYAYGNQPNIAVWNLARFAESLLPLLHDDQEKAVEIAQVVISGFTEQYRSNWLSGMKAKLGLFGEEPEDGTLIQGLLDLMQKYQADYTNTFVSLTFDKYDEAPLFRSEEFAKWKALWQARLDRQSEDRDAAHRLMRNSNPAIIPRNHRVEEALDAAVNHGNYDVTLKFLDILTNPFAHSSEQAEYSAPPPPSACRYRTFCGT